MARYNGWIQGTYGQGVRVYRSGTVRGGVSAGVGGRDIEVDVVIKPDLSSSWMRQEKLRIVIRKGYLGRRAEAAEIQRETGQTVDSSGLGEVVVIEGTIAQLEEMFQQGRGL